MTKPGLATSSVLSCDFSRESLPSGAFFSLRCLIYKVHAVPGGTLLILQNLFEFVKYFFQKFFDIFVLILRFQQLFLSYHNQFALSRTFLKVFNFARCFVRAATFDKLPHFAAAVKCFFLSLSGAVLTALTALLEYQTVRQKSTLFLALCLLFLRRLSFSLIFGIYLTASLI